MNFIISAGYKYIDIDVLASSIALRELMHLLGKKAKVHLTGPFNATIPTRFIDSIAKDINRIAPPKSNGYDFILVDISDPLYVESFVKIDKVCAVYDHHYGYEEFWKKRIGNQARIEPIGACATLIWEEFKTYNFHKKISSLAANLLYTAIISNTLNFKAQVTSLRDKTAAKEILRYVTLPENWVKQYYRGVESQISAHMPNCIQKDTKIVSLSHLNFFFSQLEVYNATSLMKKYNFYKEMADIFIQKNWVLNLVSIEEECSYLFTNSEKIENILKNNFSIKSQINFLRTEYIWLRKNILKVLCQHQIY
jgi:nanoRNase/pAp phosphatase (c-di-AMP/oligoRNAs hydrolase)